MNRTASFLVGLSLLAVAPGAWAEAGEAAPPKAGVAPRGMPSCEIGERGKLTEKQVHVWRALLCDELVYQGLTAAPGGAGAQEVYRLDVLALGEKIVVRLAHEKDGAQIGAERAVLANSDELLVALPRLVAAVKKGEDFAQTATVTNPVAQEARPPVKSSGEFFVGGSLFGMAPLGMNSAGVMPGIAFGLLYETPSFGFVADLRYAFGKEGFSDSPAPSLDDPASSYSSRPSPGNASWFAVSAGGRHFFLDTDISPFVGGGLAISWTALFPSDTAGKSSLTAKDLQQNSGFGLYGEAGFEILRTHQHRASLGLRLDLPLYTLPARTGASSAPSDAGTTGTTTGTTGTAGNASNPGQATGVSEASRSTAAGSYVVPVSLTATYYLP